MKSKFLFLLVTAVLLGCKNEVTPEDVARINGYWEIEKVIMPDGKTKDYTINTTVDYFEIKQQTGIRKKVSPQIDGTYRENGQSESISVTFANGDAYLNYNTDFAKWQEKILRAEDSVLILKNSNNLEYHYKRPILFSKK